nr:DNA alkylation repair protein [Anaeroplasmataceae bacterium]
MIKQVKQELIALSSSQMANYSHKLIPNSLPILGVSIPNIRKLAKKFCKLDFRGIIEEYDSSSFELQMLVGIIIATAPLSLEERFTYLNEFIPKICDWAVCDCLVNSLKCCKDHLRETLDFILKYKTSQKEFEVRFLVVMLLNYYINE